MSFGLLLSAALVTMSPDYSGITVPPNLAPLNFDLDRAAEVTLAGPDGAVLGTQGREIRFAIPDWRAFLAKCRGRSYTMTVKPADGTEPLVATNAVSADAVDGYLTYRLLKPSYMAYDKMGIYQRDLTTFDERPLYRTVQTSRGQCVNCHTYRQGDPETFLFHRRAVGTGTVIDHPKYGLSLRQIRPDRGFRGNGSYPAWHPSGEFIAFSVNDTCQTFYLGASRKVEVADLQSDLVLYSLADGRTVSVESEPKVFECFPTWSPDGRTLYTARARVDYEIAPSNEELRVSRTYRHIERLRYDIVARYFDAANLVFSEPRVLIDANRRNRSFLFPRVSPDGRWMVVTAADYGVFPIWHPEADLWLFDLGKGTLRELTEVNAPGADSYHCFSSDGKWMVFSSRRIDGVYTRPYVTHFDAATGTFTKPFLLPVGDPAEHRRRFLSYNIPEFSTGPLRRSPRELRSASMDFASGQAK